eukprot:6194722-Pleurochrysis_carterae.AAC.1
MQDCADGLVCAAKRLAEHANGLADSGGGSWAMKDAGEKLKAAAASLERAGRELCGVALALEEGTIHRLEE